MMRRKDPSLLLQREPDPASTLGGEDPVHVAQLRHALQVLKRSPQLSRDARRRGTRALEAACARLTRSSHP